MMAAAISTRQSRPVPNSAVMKVGVITVMLIEFIAAMPCGTGSRASAAMTKLEKAKNTPPTTPEPIAAMKVRVGRSFGSSQLLQMPVAAVSFA